MAHAEEITGAKTLSLESPKLGKTRFVVRSIIPAIAVMAFIVMVAVGESQVRTSPNWPPPARHELGAWEIQPPAVLDWAARLNLPATLPILCIASHNDAFSYAFDDHYLIAYIPWIFLVYCLWYLVAFRLARFLMRQPWKSTTQRNLVLCAQAFVTLEMLYAWAVVVMGPEGPSAKPGFICLCGWSLLVILGWVDFLTAPRQDQRSLLSTR